MNARMLGIICALLAAMPNLIGCESSRSQDSQFEKQVKRAQECRQLQDKLVGDQPLTESPIPWREPNVLPGSRPLMPVPCAFPLKDDSASTPQDQHNLI
jgi:hypothetical protein